MNPPPNLPCACQSGAKYKRCCRPAHRGMAIEAPETLMRARFTAFAHGLAAFVMDTTHPSGPSFESDRGGWERSILEFSAGTEFAGLAILAASDDGDEGSVTFRATLLQGTRDVSFTEQSRFVRVEGRWLYHSGVIS